MINVYPMKNIFCGIFFSWLALGTFGQNAACNASKQMDRTTFDSLTLNYLTAMRNQSKFDTLELVCMVKIHNTLTIADNYYRNPNSKEFLELFDQTYLQEAFQKLECTYGDGMTVYSPKYDIAIAFDWGLDKNDFWEIIDGPEKTESKYRVTGK
jgi:hypothetical protein